MGNPVQSGAIPEAVAALQDIDLTVYSWVLDRQILEADAIAEETGLDPQEVMESIDRLLGAKLVHRDPEQETRGYAVAPETAIAELATPIEVQVRVAHERLDRIRADLGRFVPYFHRHRSSSDAYEVLDSLQEVRVALSRAARRVGTEMISSQPGGGARVPEAMQEAFSRDRDMLERGVSIRTLYHHTARFNAPSQAYVAAASALGAQYRTAHELFGRLIVFDRELAFIPSLGGSWGAVLIREPSTVAYLCEIFDQTWEQATPFADAAAEGLERVSREIDETILRLLAGGLKDETIARRLGMSLRTTRRHIAEIMDQLNAESRFQAGVAAAMTGLLRPEKAPGTDIT
jgi:DNA-binding CsgD family transcriptional regulator/sugar-specific transcriptional regulator TrmB